MCPEDLVAFVAALAIAIAKETSAEELPVYAAIFVMLGDTLAAYIAQSDHLESICQNKDSSNTVC